MKTIKIIIAMMMLSSVLSACANDIQENTNTFSALSALENASVTAAERAIPTYVPTPTPKPRATHNPLPTPTSSPIPVPTFTPVPAPIPTISPTPVLEGELGAEALADIFANIDGDAGCVMNYYVTEGADGTVYYMNNGAIYAIDSISGVTTKILDEKAIEEEIDLGIEYSYFSIYSIFFADKELYAGIAIVNSDGNYSYCVIDVLNRKMTDMPDGDIYSYCDDSLLMLDYDYYTNKCSYYIYDIVRKKRIVLLDTVDWHEYILLKFVTDKYLIFERGKWTENSQGEDICSYMTVIADKNSLEIVNTISEDELDISNIYILSCGDEWMLYYDYMDNALKVYNIEKNKVSGHIDFYGATKILGYDADNKWLYIRQSVNYTHRTDNLCGDEWHWRFDECIDETELSNAEEKFIKLDLQTMKSDVIYTAKTTNYMADDICLGLMRDFIVGDYVFAYYPVVECEGTPNEYFYAKFKLGEGIDYDTWRD